MSTFERFNCAICFGWLDNTQHVCVTECNHVYHEECLNIWEQRQDRCPMCRQKILAVRRLVFNSAPFQQDGLQEELNRAYKLIGELEKKLAEDGRSSQRRSQEHDVVMGEEGYEGDADEENSEGDVEEDHFEEDVQEGGYQGDLDGESSEDDMEEEDSEEEGSEEEMEAGTFEEYMADRGSTEGTSVEDHRRGLLGFLRDHPPSGEEDELVALIDPDDSEEDIMEASSDDWRDSEEDDSDVVDSEEEDSEEEDAELYGIEDDNFEGDDSEDATEEDDSGEEMDISDSEEDDSEEDDSEEDHLEEGMDIVNTEEEDSEGESSVVEQLRDLPRFLRKYILSRESNVYIYPSQDLQNLRFQ